MKSTKDTITLDAYETSGTSPTRSLVRATNCKIDTIPSQKYLDPTDLSLPPVIVASNLIGGSNGKTVSDFEWSPHLVPCGWYLVRLGLDKYPLSIVHATSHSGKLYTTVNLRAEIEKPLTCVSDQFVGRFIYGRLTTLKRRKFHRITSDLVRLLEVLGAQAMQLRSDRARVESLVTLLDAKPKVRVFAGLEAYSPELGQVVLPPPFTPTKEQPEHRIQQGGDLVPARFGILQYESALETLGVARGEGIRQ